MPQKWSGDLLLSLAVAVVAAFLVGLAASPYDMLAGVRGFPAPTASWATIVTGLAWPTVVLIVLWRARTQMTVIFAHLARRFGSDNVEFGGLKLTVNDRQTEVGDDPSRAAVRDLFRDPAKRDKVERWIAANGGPGIDRVAFATAKSYIGLRHKMLDEVDTMT